MVSTITKRRPKAVNFKTIIHRMIKNYICHPEFFLALFDNFINLGSLLICKGKKL
jgi:hypothetical protein